MATQKDKEALLAELQRDLQYCSKHTTSQYLSHAVSYLLYVGTQDWTSKDVLYTYIDKLKKQGLIEKGAFLKRAFIIPATRQCSVLTRTINIFSAHSRSQLLKSFIMKAAIISQH